jgi:hypothetical protein
VLAKVCLRLNQTRSLFSADERFHHSLNAFIRCGLAVASDGKFAWTNAIAPHMQSANFWAEDRSGVEDCFEKDFATFLQNLPDGWRYEMAVLAREPNSSAVFIAKFRQDFDKFGWSKQFSAPPRTLSLGLKLFETVGGRR